jgi:linoleoyl-CoA desaturase
MTHDSTDTPLAVPRPTRRVTLSVLIRPTAPEIARARRRLHAKATAIAVLVATSYWLLVFVADALLVQIGCAIALAVGVTAIGTGIMHDANHGAFCRSRRANRLVAYSADLVGASSWVWRFKHNTLHHAHTNIVGVDSDIEQAPFARLAPAQPWYRWHRYQHLYLWVLYGFLATKWFLVSDVVALTRGGFGPNRFARPARRRDVVLLAAGKLVHVSWAILIPLSRHPWWGVAAFYLAGSWLVGFILAMVFQLAHCTDEVTFLEPTAVAAATGAESFELRQLRTTADIRCQVPVVGGFVRWLMGGLDHQIEHHLAPRLPHTLYAAMAPRLEAICAERNLPYHLHLSLWAAIRAHGRWLKLLGQRPGPTEATSGTCALGDRCAGQVPGIACR